MGERKLVEAFKTFFQKSVSPYLSGNDEVMREWNHLNKIISADPIDYSQIEFYLLLANKNSSSKGTISSSNKLPEDSNRFRYSDFNAVMEKSTDRRGGYGGSGIATGSKRKNLVSGLQNFQKMLTLNQERLQTMIKKQGGFAQPGSQPNGINLRRY